MAFTVRDYSDLVVLSLSSCGVPALPKMKSATRLGSIFCQRSTQMSGPPPQYQPTFTTEQLDEARALAACHQAPYVQVQRAKLALALAANPDISNPDLGRGLGTHPNTAFKWRKDWTLHRFHLEDHPRAGRPPTFSPSANRRNQSGRLRTAISTSVALQSSQSG